MRVFWSEWPNEPALAELQVGGIVTVRTASTEVKLLSDLARAGNAILLCSTLPRWCFRLPERVAALHFDGHPVLPAVRQLVDVGRYQVYGNWMWTPELHSLCRLMREPRPWVLELTECDRPDGGNADNRVDPAVGAEGGCDKDQ